MRTIALTALGLLILFSSSAAPAGEEEAVSRFRRANDLYARQDYAGALRLYREIIDQGWESAPVYYNLGNAYFKEGRLGQAILSYRKAEKLSPSDPEIKKNLQYARRSVKDDLAALKPPLFTRIKESLVRLFPLRTWFLLTSFLYLLTGLWIITAAVFRPLKKLLFPVLKVLLPIFIMAALLTGFGYFYYSAPRGIVLDKAVVARYGPAEDNASAFELHQGSEVRVARKKNGWIQVILPDGKTGWLPADSLGLI